MTAEGIASVVGFILSIGLEVVPGLKDKWATWKWKLLVMAGLNLLVGIGIWVLVCPMGVDLKMVVECTVNGALTALYLGLIAFATSQTTYTVVAKRLPNKANHV